MWNNARLDGESLKAKPANQKPDRCIHTRINYYYYRISPESNLANFAIVWCCFRRSYGATDNYFASKHVFGPIKYTKYVMRKATTSEHSHIVRIVRHTLSHFNIMDVCDLHQCFRRWSHDLRLVTLWGSSHRSAENRTHFIRYIGTEPPHPYASAAEFNTHTHTPNTLARAWRARGRARNIRPTKHCYCFGWQMAIGNIVPARFLHSVWVTACACVRTHHTTLC